MSAPINAKLLWFAGAAIFLASLIATIVASVLDCAGQDMSCQLNSLMWLTGGFLGMFLGAVLFISGFASRAKIRAANDEAKLAYLVEMAKQEIAAERARAEQDN